AVGEDAAELEADEDLRRQYENPRLIERRLGLFRKLHRAGVRPLSMRHTREPPRPVPGTRRVNTRQASPFSCNAGSRDAGSRNAGRSAAVNRNGVQVPRTVRHSGYASLNLVAGAKRLNGELDRPERVGQ